MFRSVFFISMALFFILSPISQLNARWGDKDDANLEYLEDTTTIKVKASGEWTMRRREVLKVLTDAGRDEASLKQLGYESKLETLRITRASTLNPSTTFSDTPEEFPVPEADITDKSCADEGKILTSRHQVNVPYQNVIIGSHLILESERIGSGDFRELFPHYFSHNVRFDEERGTLWTHRHVIIESELPLYLACNNPRDHLQVTYSPNKVEIKLNKQLLEELYGEDSFLDPATQTYASISTEKDYERIGRVFAEKYKAVLSHPLPKALERLRDAAASLTNERECINTIVKTLIEQNTYLSRSDSLIGALIPRSLEDIVKGGNGDCKESSIVLSAILNTMGYKTTPVCVFRGLNYVERKTQPSWDDFNHVVLEVVGPSGETYLVDPTNPTAKADLILPDIAGRPALVLDPDKPRYIDIPPTDYRREKTAETIKITIKGNTAEIFGEDSYQGSAAEGVKSTLIKNADAVVRTATQQSLCTSPNPRGFCLDLPTDISPQANSVTITYSFQQDLEDTLTRTQNGYIFPLNVQWPKTYLRTSPDTQEGGILLDHPHSKAITQTLVSPGLRVDDLSSLAFDIKSNWVNAKRELHASEGRITIISIVEQTRDFISAAEVKSPAFKKLLGEIRLHCKDVAISLPPLPVAP